MKKNAKRLKKIYSKVAILLIVVLCCSLVYKVLSDGFKIDNLSIANIKISGLYLKLNKKLILEIKNIDLQNFKRESSEIKPPKISDITQFVRYAVGLSSFFERLDLPLIQTKNEKYFVLFDGESFKVDIPFILADFSLNTEQSDIMLDIKTLKVKNEDLDIKGRVLYLERGGIFAFDLESYINNRTDDIISFQGESDFKYLNVVLDSTRLSSIEILAPYIKMLDSDVYEWMYERSKFSAITIKRAYLYTKTLENIDRVVTDNLYASGILKNVDLNFDENLAHITAPEVAVVFEKGKLSFLVQNAEYGAIQSESKKIDLGESNESSAKNGTNLAKSSANQKSANLAKLPESKSANLIKSSANQNSTKRPTTRISKATVELDGFFEPQTLLKINLNLNATLLDSNVLEILDFYDINLPLRQMSGTNSGNLTLDILLPTGKLETKATAQGNISTKNSLINIAGIDMLIKDANIAITPEFVSANKAKVEIRDILRGEASFKVDINAQKVDLKLNPQFFVFKNGDTEILNLGKTALNATMDFNDNFSAKIAPLDINVRAIENDTIIIGANLAKIAPYAPLLNLLDMKNGFIALRIPQNSDSPNQMLGITAKVDKLNYPLYYLNKNRVTTLQIDGTINGDELNLTDKANKLNLKIALESGDIDLNISDKFINISELLESKIPLFASMREDSGENSSKNMQDSRQTPKDSRKKNNTNLLIDGKNLSFGLFGYTIPFDESMLKLTKNGFIANGKNKNGIANIILDSETLSVEANNFNADFVNKVFEKDLMDGGSFGVFGIYRGNRFVGDISAFDTTIKEMATLQNILTFIDTIPSLLVFKMPGFSASGYEVEDAQVRVGIDSDYIAIENININGSSVDITGNGVVDLNARDLNVRLELSTIKSLSSILNKIPIIGFLLLGEDGKITTDLTIKGSLEAPQTEISLLEDTAKAPINILKRVFSPFQILIDELKKENKKRRGAR